MNKTCPNCKREIDGNVKFCPFCAAFAGEEEKEKKKSHIGAIIGGAVGVLALGTAAAVFAFDVPGIFGKETETLYGTGDKLFNLSLSPAKSGDKWGYIGKDGKFRIKPQFDCAYPFDENANGTAAVSNGYGYGFINDKGEFTVEPQFALASFYSDNGLSVVTAKDGYMLYVDGKGRTAYDGKHFTYASPFENGEPYSYAYTVITQSVKTANGEDINDITEEYYLLSSDGKTVNTVSDNGKTNAGSLGIDCVFGEYYVGFASDTEINEGSNDFTKKDYAVFAADGEQKSEWHDRIFVTEEFVVMCDTDYETGIYKAEVYDKSLNKVSDEYCCDRNQEFTGSGLVLVKIEDKRYRKVLVILKGGKLEEVYKESDGTAVISGFDSSGIACVYDKGKYCGYTVDGKAFACDYPFTSFNCGLAPFYDNKSGKIGYINTDGKIAIKARYDAVSEFYADGYAYVYENGGYEIIDISGQTAAENLSFTPTKLINNSVNHNWYTPKCFDGAEYYENTVNFGKVKVRIADDDEFIWTEDGLPSYKSSLISVSDGKAVSGNSTVVKNYGEFEDGYAVIEKNGFYLLDSKGNVIPITSDRYDNFYSLKCGNEYFYGVYDNASNGFAMSDVNGNTVNIPVSKKGKTESLVNGFVVTENDSTNIQRSRYSIYTDSLTKPFVMSTNNYVTFLSTNGKITEMSVQYYGSVDSGNDVWRITDAVTGECLITKKNVEGYLCSFGGYFAVLQPDDQSLYWDVNGEIGYLQADDKVYYTVGGKYIGIFVTAFACDDKLLAVCDNGKYKLYSRYGELLGEYSYACMSDKSQYIVVEKDGRYVCLDRRMNEVFESEYPFNPPVNNYAAYADLTIGKIGFLDMSGNIAIPAFADYISDFSTDGYARMSDDYENVSYGTANETLIDTQGKTVYESNVLNSDMLSFEHGNEYFKTLYSFAGGYKYFIDYFREHKYEMKCDDYSNIANACRLLCNDFAHDTAGNLPYQFILANRKIAYIENLSLLYDGTPVISTYHNRVISGDVYGQEIEKRYYGLDGKEIKIEKYDENGSEIYLNGYFYQTAYDDESKTGTLYALSDKGELLYEFTEPGSYYDSLSTENGYLFAFKHKQGKDGYETAGKNILNTAEVYTTDKKLVISCENVVADRAVFVKDSTDEIRFTCKTGDNEYTDRIYSLSEGKFVREEEAYMTV